MSTLAKTFIAATIAAGSLVLLACLAGDRSFPDPSRFLYCLTLALLASTFKIKLPGMQSTIGASFVLFLIALTELPFRQTLIIVVLSTLVQCLWRSEKRPKIVQLAFKQPRYCVNPKTSSLHWLWLARCSLPSIRAWCRWWSH
jgi:hypothetical protein